MNLPIANPKTFLKSIYASDWGIPIVFACLGLVGTLNHVMWRDEMNVWLIARDSHSWGELLSNLHYDRGHPALWHLLVAATERFFDTPVAMQILHLVIAIGSVCVVWCYSPFPRWAKTLFIFSYLPFYEFLLLSRNYGIGMLLLFAACAAFPARDRRCWPIAIFLALAANTNTYALLVAVPLSFTLILECLIDPEHRRAYFAKAKAYDWAISLIILAVGYYIAYSFILPPADAAAKNAVGGWFLHFDLRHLLRSIGRLFGGYFLIVPAHHRWIDLIVCDSIGLAVAGLTVLKLLRKPFPLFFYTTASGLLLSFTYFKFLGRGLRHYGHFYLILIMALWLASYYHPVRRLQPVEDLAQRWHQRCWVVILCIQLLGGIGEYVADFIQPLSASRAAAQYIRQENLQDEFIVAYRDANMAPLSGYLGRQFYYAETQAMGSYTLFFKGNRVEVEPEEMLRQTRQLLDSDPALAKILLISHKELPAEPLNLTLTPITRFKKAQEVSERYYLYWAEPKN